MGRHPRPRAGGRRKRLSPSQRSANPGGLGQESAGASRSPLDVAPTVWATLGLPLSRELPGRPIRFLGMPSAYRYVSTYGRPFAETAPRTGKPLDQEMIDRLRSLG